MDDERIRRLTQEVLADLSRPAESDAPGVADLEARVAALEAMVRDVRGGPAGGGGPLLSASVLVTSADRTAQPSLRLLDLGGGSRQCLMEPDKPCVQSGQCRTFGH
ncbi:MAG TPA: hypothetical protein VLI67_00075 [Vicinamibacteria bacterium]|nr:hypothetical protein [Vicinamibacteria bacterium]